MFIDIRIGNKWAEGKRIVISSRFGDGPTSSKDDRHLDLMSAMNLKSLREVEDARASMKLYKRGKRTQVSCPAQGPPG